MCGRQVNAMQIIVAGNDRTDELGAEIKRSAAMRRRGREPAFVDPAINSLCLSSASSEEEYLSEFVRLLRHRDAFDAMDIDVPRRRGALGWALAGLKMAMWRLLRHQYARIAFRQNLINRMFTNALECETALRERELRELRQKVETMLSAEDAGGRNRKPSAHENDRSDKFGAS